MRSIKPFTIAITATLVNIMPSQSENAADATLVNMKPSHSEDAAEAVFSTPHSCLPNPCSTHCSPAHANLCPPWMHRLKLGTIN